MVDDKAKNAAAAKPLAWVRFKDHEPVKLPNGKMSTPPEKVEFGNGPVRRTFRAEKQPFEVAPEEVEALLTTGLFVVTDAPAEIPAKSEDPDKAPPKSEDPNPADTPAAQSDAGALPERRSKRTPSPRSAREKIEESMSNVSDPVKE